MQNRRLVSAKQRERPSTAAHPANKNTKKVARRKSASKSKSPKQLSEPWNTDIAYQTAATNSPSKDELLNHEQKELLKRRARADIGSKAQKSK